MDALLGVACHSWPGTTNLISGVPDADMNRAPVLASAKARPRVCTKTVTRFSIWCDRSYQRLWNNVRLISFCFFTHLTKLTSPHGMDTSPDYFPCAMSCLSLEIIESDRIHALIANIVFSSSRVIGNERLTSAVGVASVVRIQRGSSNVTITAAERRDALVEKYQTKSFA